jgi:steroid delta-isomerase-like uncharacterized protein
MMSIADNKRAGFDLVRSFFSAFDDHDLDLMLMTCAKDARVSFVPMGKQGEGEVRELGASFWSSLFHAVPNLRVVVQSMFGREQSVAAEVIIGGRQQHAFEDIPGRDRPFELPHAFIIRLNDSTEITHITAYWDNVTLFSELGKPVA